MIQELRPFIIAMLVLATWQILGQGSLLTCAWANGGRDGWLPIYNRTDDIELVMDTPKEMLGSDYTTVAKAAQESKSGKLPSWLLQASSVYVDGTTKKEVKVTGTGVTVKVGDQYFLLSDSHLTQGERKTEIRDLAGNPVAFDPADRLANNQTDLELIRITSPVHGPVFEYHPECGAGFVIFSDSDPKTFPYVSLSGTHFTPSVPWESAKPESFDFTEKRLNQPYETYDSRSKDGSYHGSLMYQVARQQGGLYYNGLDRVFESGIVAGQSGSPVLMDLTHYGKTGACAAPAGKRMLSLEGLVKSYHRYFKTSYTSSARDIENLVSAYQSGKRGKLGAVTWKFDKISFRDFGNGTQEFNPNQEPSGSASALDAGGNHSGDGGGNHSGDGGGNHSGDGGHLSVNQRTLNGNFEPGMRYKGQQVIAFHMKSPWLPSGKNAEFQFAAEPEVLWAVERFKEMGYEVKPVPVGADLSKSIAGKLENTPFDPPMGQEADSLYDIPGACAIEQSKKDGKTVTRVRLPYDPQDPSAKSYFIELDQDGRLLGSQEGLKEILSLSTPDGDRVNVDLRGLYSFAVSTDRWVKMVDAAHLPQKFMQLPYIIYQAGKKYQSDDFFCYRARRGTFDHAIRLSAESKATPGAVTESNSSDCVLGSQPTAPLSSSTVGGIEKVFRFIQAGVSR